MKVLSLFDGISCGMVALERAGIQVDRYVAYEIEESAIKISQHHYPNIEECGDVFKADFTQYEGFDILIGGSPCTYWSVARTNAGRETTSSGMGWDLFSQYVRALEESKCKYFLYENNYSMSSDIKAEITKALGVEPIYINSELVSAQHRKRLYWTNIPNVQQPSDKGILLENIIESGAVDRKKSLCIARRTVGNQGSQSYMRRRYFGKSFAQMVFENCTPQSQKELWQYDPNKEFETDGYIRPLTITEMERLQTLPDGYTAVEGVSDTQRGESIGNGWTVDVIAHIFSYLLDKYKKKQTLSCFGDYDASNNQCMRHCDIWIECEKAERKKWDDEVKEIKQMELRVNEYQIPAPITFNYEELKQGFIEKTAMYTNLVYTDEQIKEAKTDRASLNKLKTALNDERKRLEKEYMQPFNDTKAKFNELIALIDEPVAAIDSQVKAYEEKQREEKLQKINEYIEEVEKNLPDGVHIPIDCKWLNASVSMKSIKSEIDAKVEQIQNDLATLQNLPEFGFEATEVYKTTLDMNKALNEGKRLSEIAKAKAVHEAEMKARAEEQARLAEEKVKAVESMNVTQPTPVELNNNMSGEFVGEPLPAKQWVKFQAFMTVEQAMELKKFFDDRQIEFKAV